MTLPKALAEVIADKYPTLYSEVTNVDLRTHLKAIKPETYNSIGSAHKYWGKKPYNIVSALISHFTKAGDVVLDPFCGSGVTVTQSYLSGRRAIGVDLNPSAVFISNESNQDTPIPAFDAELKALREDLRTLEHGLYAYKCECGKLAILVAAVRGKDDSIKRLKLKCSTCGVVEREVCGDDIIRTHSADHEPISEFYPQNKMHQNGRINVKKDQKISDFYTQRNLLFCSALWARIEKISDPRIQNALKLAFTANLSNASKLTPIIKQRGPMNAGAWMTGFYIAGEYLEQNVLHYFLNRAAKVRNAKIELSEKIAGKKLYEPKIYQADARNLSMIKDESVDFVFADPPYGDTVPYLEQSLLWNSWLGASDSIFDDEIVISDSKERGKREPQYFEGIRQAFKEVSRVSKSSGHLCITFHSMKGRIWAQFMTAIAGCGFELSDIYTIYQKTSTPRQLNRLDSIKCDFLLVFKKCDKILPTRILEGVECGLIITDELQKMFEQKTQITTDEIISAVYPVIFKLGIPNEDWDLVEFVGNNYSYENGFWRPCPKDARSDSRGQ